MVISKKYVFLHIFIWYCYSRDFFDLKLKLTIEDNRVKGGT